MTSSRDPHAVHPGHTSRSRPAAGEVAERRGTVTIHAPSRTPWLKLALIGGGVVVLAALVVLLRGGAADAGMPDTFPNSLIPVGAAGTAADVRLVRASVAPGRCEIDGVVCWPAWQCLNEDCPGRSAGKPFIFPHSDEPGPGSGGPYASCPRCRAAKDRRRDPTNISPYYTDEALRLMERRK